MELRRLRYFIAVAEELNFHRAAEKLHLGQSPLSKQIRKLEEEVGTPLLTRNTRRVELTHAGREFLEAARAIVAKSLDAAQRAQSVAAGRAGKLRVGYLTSLTNERFSAIMTAFIGEYPDVELVLYDLVPEAILAALRERQIDVGFFRAAFRDEELAAREIWRDRFMVALPRTHWLAGRGPVAIRSLVDETFIMVPDQGSMGLNESIRAMSLKAGFTPKRRIEVNQLQAAIWLVHLGLGIAVVPESLQGLHRDNVVYQPVNRGPTLGAFMVWRKEATSPVLDRFRAIVQRQTAGSR